MNTEKSSLGILYQTIMLFLCCYVLGALFTTTVFKLDPETEKIIDWLDNVICVVFLGDFGWNLYTARSKWGYLRWGWIDLISSIPVLNVFRAGRLFRIIRIVRILRGVRSAKMMIQFIFKDRAKGSLSAVAMLSLLMITFSSIAILNVEVTENANIQSAEDALWWSFVTITTVGYGDKYPVTTEGRIIGVLLMVTGVGLFGTFTGFVANSFLSAGKKEEAQEQGRYEALMKEVQELKQLVAQGNLRNSFSSPNK